MRRDAGTLFTLRVAQDGASPSAMCGLFTEVELRFRAGSPLAREKILAAFGSCEPEKAAVAAAPVQEAAVVKEVARPPRMAVNRRALAKELLLCGARFLPQCGMLSQLLISTVQISPSSPYAPTDIF